MGNLPAAVLIDFNWGLSDIVDVLEELLGKVIAVVDQTLPSKDIDSVANYEVLGSIELFLLQAHTRIVGMNRNLWKLLPSQQQWEGITTRILSTLLFDLNTIVSEEVVDGEEVYSTLKCIVLPKRIKRQHFPIVVEILGEATVGVSASELNLKVFLVLLCVWWVDLHILLINEAFERVGWFWFGVIELVTNIFIEFLGKLVAVVHSEDALIKVDVLAQLEILPSIVVVEETDFLWNLLSLDEDALWNAAVFDSRLQNQYGLIREVVVNGHLANSVVLQTAFHDMLLEVGVESQYLPVVLQPGCLDAWNVVVPSCLPFRVHGKVKLALGHGVEQVLIGFLLDRCRLEGRHTTLQVELVSFVVVLLVRISEDVPRKHGHLLGEIGLHCQLYLLYRVAN
jgi:hypothetical protein